MSQNANTAELSPNQMLWEKGDFTRIAASMRDSGEKLVKAIGVGPGQKVLDLGCGDGTTALPSARLGAEVLGVDIARNLVEAGNRRAADAGLFNLRFQHGDASNLTGVASSQFDKVISIFGAMFAPNPENVAREMVRVTKPGRQVVMGNWIPGDPTLVAQILKTSAAYSPPPPEGFVSPVRWGVEADVRARFTGAGVPDAAIRCEPETYVFDHAGTPADFVAEFRDHYGPTMNAFAAANANGKAADLERELIDLFESQNTSRAAGRTVIPATFLRVTVQVG
ncbi:class I SAM-dependent methyltransferase [Hyphomonas sp.]|uniref:class I SAM-dependent methyltransferase n=1 Tax=Hyphomonas sp. TaxID=87 RepID=UPI0025C34401|nr:class I SAM-dependent methyltransferase [Hyphomonas sp.]MBI1398976.1 methyltransferase domain-containing protein [Hyphomonas sp.]